MKIFADVREYLLLNNEAYENVWPILRYMKEHGKKLEQESIL